MKKILMLGALLTMLVSCDKKEKKYTLTNAEKARIEQIIENSLQINYFSTAKTAAEIKIESSEVKEINGEIFLVSMYKEYRTNSLLKKNEETMQYVYAGISCTSIRCSNSDGCIPDGGTKCTPCGHGAGDCSKTVTN